MSGSENFLEKMVTEEKKRIKAFQNRLFSNWFWFLAFGVLGIITAYFVSYYSPPKYQAKSTILVQNESNALQGKEFFDDDGNMLRINIQDHIGVLKSKSLASQVIKNLNWRTSWYSKMLFYDMDLYGREPFLVFETGNGVNPHNIPFYITMISEQEFIVRADDFTLGDMEIQAFEQRGKFGVPFESETFGFVLEQNPDLIVPFGVEYHFVFNDLEGLSLELTDKLEVKLDDLKGNLIALKMTGMHAQRVVDYLNGLGREYIDFCLAEKNRISENTVHFIDLQLEGVEDSLNQTGYVFSDFQSQNKSLNLEQEAGIVRAELKKMEEEYSVAERKLNYYRNLNRYLNNSSQFERVEKNLQKNFGEISGTKNVVAPSVVGVTDPVLNNLVLKLGELNSKKEVLAYSVKQNEPNMLVLEKEIRHTKKSLRENLANLLVNAENDISSIAKRIGNQKKLMVSLPRMEQKFVNIKRRYDLNNDLYNFLLKKRTEAEITIASNVPNSQVVDRASLMSVEKVGPRTLLNMALGLLLGIFLPFLFLRTTDYFDNTIGSIYELEKETDLPVLGIITHNRHRKDVLVARRPKSGITESFRSLRTDLENFMAVNPQKVVSVQSVIPGEGKSFVSLNLAAILAMNDKKVLLVEADMRKPKLSKVFGLNGLSGISSYLKNEESFEDIVSPTQIDNLSFVPAGPVPLNPAELLANGKFRRFIETVRGRYNYVIMDSAPISVVTDGLLSGKHADVNLFVLRHRFSKKSQMNYINKLVDKGSIKNVALLLNDFKFTGVDFGLIGYRNGYYEDDYIPLGVQKK